MAATRCSLVGKSDEEIAEGGSQMLIKHILEPNPIHDKVINKIQVFSGLPEKRIWMFGSSIVCNAFLWAKNLIWCESRPEASKLRYMVARTKRNDLAEI